jgi:hypothetical protein
MLPVSVYEKEIYCRMILILESGLGSHVALSFQRVKIMMAQFSVNLTR